MSMRISSKTQPFDFDIQRTCKNCANTFSGRYCNRCGEKVIEPADKAISSLFGNVFNAMTFVDDKFYRTLRLMLLKPGALSDNYIHGVRMSFIKPVSIFFFANLLYFLIPIFDTFNSSLHTQMYYLPYSELAAKVVERRIAVENTTLEDFTIRYEQQSTNLAKLLLIIFVVLLAVPIMLMNYNKRMYFVDHLIVSFELNTLIILIGMVVFPWLVVFTNKGLSLVDVNIIPVVFRDNTYSMILAVLVATLFYFIQRTVYKDNWWISLGKGVIVVPAILVVLQLYRAILFFVTMWTL